MEWQRDNYMWCEYQHLMTVKFDDLVGCEMPWHDCEGFHNPLALGDSIASTWYKAMFYSGGNTVSVSGLWISLTPSQSCYMPHHSLVTCPITVLLHAPSQSCYMPHHSLVTCPITVLLHAPSQSCYMPHHSLVTYPITVLLHAPSQSCYMPLRDIQEF